MTQHDVLTRAEIGLNVLVPPLADAIGMSRAGLYQAIARGEVASVRVGRAIFVPAHETRRLLGMPSAPAAKAAA